MKTLRGLIEQSQVLDLGPLPAPRMQPTATVHQALQFLVRGRRGAIVVVEGSKPVGIFTERDVVYRIPDGLFVSPERRRRLLLREVMSRPVRTVRRQDLLVDAVEAMVRDHYRHLVVVGSDGELRGLLTTNDLVQFLTERFPEDTINLPPRLHQSYDSQEGA